MRRKPSPANNNYNNRPQKPRYQQNGGGQGSQHMGNRQRKNYPALREKYLNQARDALASGDRVLAENYFQHADHAYRMMVEEGQPRQHSPPPPQAAEGQDAAPGNVDSGNADTG